MKKYAIITPTYSGHFQYIKKYLKSFDKYVMDKQNIEIVFTISKSERQEFEMLVSRYISKLDLKILNFEDILHNFGIKYTPEELLVRYGKFTFQTLKKFYTMIYSEAEYFLVLDSESMLIKKTEMKDLFSCFFNSPFITASSISKRNIVNPFMRGVTDNVSLLLNKKCDKWFLENFIWFYDRKIVADLFKKYGSPIEMAEKVYKQADKEKTGSGVFEIEVYQTFIYMNNKKYGYKIIDADKILQETLSGKELAKYICIHNKYFDGNCGILEPIMVLLRKSNWKKLAILFSKYKFNIIRTTCEYADNGDYLLQKKFLDIVKPNILAASQNHCFGLNNTFKNRWNMLVLNSKPFIKLKKHLSRFFVPLGHFFSWLFEIVSSLFYLIKFCSYLLIKLKLVIFG